MIKPAARTFTIMFHLGVELVEHVELCSVGSQLVISIFFNDIIMRLMKPVS